MVLIVENSLDTTGAFNTIFSYAQYAQRDYRFIFVLPRKSRLLYRVRQAGFAVETLPFREINRRPLTLLLYLPTLFINAIRLRKIAHQHRAAIVHVNDFYNLVGVGAKALGGQFALLTHVRFMPDRFPILLVNAWMKLSLAYSGRIICVSQAVKQCLTCHPKLQVIYDGLVTVSTASVKRSGQEKGCIKLLYLAHYTPGKGQDLALEAFSRAYWQNKDLQLRMVGGDMDLAKNKQYRTSLEQQAEALGIHSAVTFAGPTTDTTEELKQADVFLNFSESESFSMTCLEALAHGVPLIVTDCGGPAELFEHNESGYLIPNRDTGAGARAILRLAADGELRRRFAENSIRYVQRKFSEENTHRKLVDVYAEVLPC